MTAAAIRVSRFESNLLQITRSILGGAPSRACAPVLVCGAPRPAGLSSRSLDVLKRMLARGVVMQLVRCGGWRKRRWLHAGETVAGRAWRCSAAAAGAFQYSEQSVEFLLWLTSTPFGVEREWVADGELTVGDRLLIFLAYDMLLEYPIVQRYTATFGQSELCRLAWPDHFPFDESLDFSAWVSGAGALPLEMLEDRLLDAWTQSAVHRLEVSDAKLNRSHADLHRHVLGTFVDACERGKRFDLARPLLRLQTQLTAARPRLEDWCRSLTLGKLAVSERFAARQDSLSLMETNARLSDWTNWARSIGFVDEDYAAAQLWLSIWEQFGGERAETTVSDLYREANPLAVNVETQQQGEG